MKKLICLILLFLVSSCSYLKVFQTPEDNNWKKNLLEDSISIKNVLKTGICILGDTGEAKDREIEKLYQSLKNDDCEQVILLGDLVYPSGLAPVSEELDKKFRYCLNNVQKNKINSCLKNLTLSNYYKNWVDKLTGSDSLFRTSFEKLFLSLSHKERVSIVMGNHDYSHNSSIDSSRRKMMNWVLLHYFSRLNNSSFSYMKNIFYPKNFYSQVYKFGLCLAFSDTATIYQNTYYNDKKGVLFDIQTDWLSNVKKEFQKQKCKYKIFVGHQPYVSSGKRHGRNKDYFMKNINRISPILKKFYEQNVLSKFDLIISGHDHHISDEGNIYLNSLNTGTRQYISGAGGHKLNGLRIRDDQIKHQGQTVWPKKSQKVYGHIKIFANNEKIKTIFKIIPNNDITEKECKVLDHDELCNAYQNEVKL